MPEFSDEQILHAITDALAEGNVEAIPGLLTVLALQAPEKAQTALDMIRFGIDLARREQLAGNPEGKGADE